jgi:diaminopimelate decarboxylase
MKNELGQPSGAGIADAADEQDRACLYVSDEEQEGVIEVNRRDWYGPRRAKMPTQTTVSPGPMLERAIRAGLLDDESPAALFYDLDAFRARLRSLADAFPGALHALAVKACPLPALLRPAIGEGFGLEVASEGELALAHRLAVPEDRVVFDSPAKTRREIAAALSRGHRLNIDNLEELARIAAIMESPEPPRPSSIGIRVNPSLSGASIAATFTAARGAKFGVDLDEDRGAILEAFAAHRWLDGLHVHAGSQGVPLSMLVDAIARVVDLALEIGARGGKVRVFDIGGGLPVGYRSEDRAPDFAEYAAALGERVPSLFSGPWKLITEFGRAIFARCGFAASRVEYVRRGGIAVIHLGADLFVRPAYRPEDWSHEIEVFGPTGQPKSGSITGASIAGPLCFSGDFIARDRPLPPIEPGDVIAIRDAGAYTLSMWSRYNSRLAPAVYGFDEGGFQLLKPRETVDDVLRFWGSSSAVS